MKRLDRFAVALGCTLQVACAGLPVATDPVPAAPEEVFAHGDLDRFLARHVDARGQVNYAAASRDSADLERYLASVAARSPDSHPEVFRSEAERLAYWLNAYNAWVLRAVLEYYPIASVREVPKPRALFFAGGLARFFVGQKLTVGGDRMSLLWLENRVIRPRFAEPRVHFALNCASRSCPRLPAEAFHPTLLEDQLQRATWRFLSEERSVRVDLEAREIWLSAIFDWYEGDFTSWLEAAHPERPATLVSYVSLHAEDDLAEVLEACAGCRVRFAEYDWALNAQP